MTSVIKTTNSSLTVLIGKNAHSIYSYIINFKEDIVVQCMERSVDMNKNNLKYLKKKYLTVNRNSSAFKWLQNFKKKFDSVILGTYSHLRHIKCKQSIRLGMKINYSRNTGVNNSLAIISNPSSVAMRLDLTVVRMRRGVLAISAKTYSCKARKALSRFGNLASILV